MQGTHEGGEGHMERGDEGAQGREGGEGWGKDEEQR